MGLVTEQIMAKDESSGNGTKLSLLAAALPKYLGRKWQIDINEPCVKKMLGAIHADETKYNYLYSLQRYCQYRYVSKVAEILKGTTVEIEDSIINYIQYMKDEEKAPTTTIRSARLAPLRKFYRNQIAY